MDIYSPTYELVILGGVCLGSMTNNIVEYQAIIGLLIESSSRGVDHLTIYLDSYFFVSHLNRIYTIYVLEKLN